MAGEQAQLLFEPEIIELQDSPRASPLRDDDPLRALDDLPPLPRDLPPQRDVLDVIDLASSSDEEEAEVIPRQIHEDLAGLNRRIGVIFNRAMPFRGPVVNDGVGLRDILYPEIEVPRRMERPPLRVVHRQPVPDVVALSDSDTDDDDVVRGPVPIRRRPGPHVNVWNPGAAPVDAEAEPQVIEIGPVEVEVQPRRRRRRAPPRQVAPAPVVVPEVEQLAEEEDVELFPIVVVVEEESETFISCPYVQIFDNSLEN